MSPGRERCRARRACLLVGAHRPRRGAARACAAAAKRFARRRVSTSRVLAGRGRRPRRCPERRRSPTEPAAARAASSSSSSAATARCCAPPSWPAPASAPLLGVNLGPRRLPRRGRARRPRRRPSTRSCARRYAVEERLTLDVAVTANGELVAPRLGAQRGQRREGRPRADARGRRRGRRPAAVPLGLRRRRLRDAHRLDGLRLLAPAARSCGRRSRRCCMVPISAHALFARPLVVAPTSVLAVEVLAADRAAGVLWCDGRRTVDLPPGARIEVRRGEQPVRLARLHHGAVHRPAGRQVRPAGPGLAGPRQRRAGRSDRPVGSACSRRSGSAALGVIDDAVLELGARADRDHRRDRRRQDDGGHRPRAAARRPRRRRRGARRARARPGRGPAARSTAAGPAAARARRGGRRARRRRAAARPHRVGRGPLAGASSAARSVPVGAARRAGRADLVAVHGQSDQHAAAAPARAARGARPLRRRGGRATLLAALPRGYAELRAVERRARRADRAPARERAQEADLLRFGLDEIEAVDPQPGEDDRAARRRRPGSATPTTLRAAAARAHEALLGASEGAATTPDADGAGRGRPARAGGGARRTTPRLAALADRLRRGRLPAGRRRRPTSRPTPARLDDRPGPAGRGRRSGGRR